MKALISVSGFVELINSDGETIGQSNLVVTAGKEWIIQRMAGNGNQMSHIGVGTDGTAADAAQTTLVTETIRKAITTLGGTPSGQNIVAETVLLAGEGTGSLQEAGLFDAATNGTMIARTTFGTYVKGAGDELTLRWTLTIS